MRIGKSFLDGRVFNKLRSMDGRDTNVIIALKLMALAEENYSRLSSMGLEDDLCREIAFEINEDPGYTVDVIETLRRCGWIEDTDDGEMYFPIPLRCHSDDDYLVNITKDFLSGPLVNRLRCLDGGDANVVIALKLLLSILTLELINSDRHICLPEEEFIDEAIFSIDDDPDETSHVFSILEEMGWFVRFRELYGDRICPAPSEE